ncbi:Aste57867_24691 [Aphanomyces stellatus]|uniref:Aste57867_24691 protein n=1 Tax=Aphanomyces stellatus TaxID=120398 RepID=A0A485LT64_9STRA|nr:hypothetical protein As57867_024613 [Aphanomyces stellatus]VFU01328.1 Aste57867_24691 [Aphanomyces stellatus]
MKRPPTTPRRAAAMSGDASVEEERQALVDDDAFDAPMDGEDAEMLTREELDALHNEIEQAAAARPPMSGKFMFRSRSRSAGNLFQARSKSFARSMSCTTDASEERLPLSREPSPSKPKAEPPKSAPSPLPPKKEKSFGSTPKKPVVLKKSSSRWDDLRSKVKKKGSQTRRGSQEIKDEDTDAEHDAPSSSSSATKHMADVAQQVIHAKRASLHMKLNVSGASARTAINGLFLEKKKLDLRILHAQFKEVKRSEFYEELVVYCIFLLMFFQLLSGLPFHDSFQQSDVTADLTCSVPDICSVDTPQDIYTFAGHLKERICLKGDADLPFQTWTRVGGLLLRQIRVKPEPCRFGFIHGNKNKSCYPAFTSANQDTADLPGLTRNYSWSDDWEPWIPGQNSWYASHMQSYGTGGYVVDLCDIDDVDELIGDTWLDVATRAVSLEFVLVNPTTHVFTVASHEFLIAASGHMKHYSQSANMRVIGLEDSATGLWLLDARVYLWFGVCLFLLTYFRGEMSEIGKMGLTAYLTLHGWNVFELAHLFLLFSTLYYTYTFYVQSMTTVSIMTLPPDAYAAQRAMVRLLDTVLQLSDFAALSSAFSLLKIFKFLRMNSTLNLLWQVLGMALKDLMGYMVIFLLIFLSYSYMGSFAFGFDLQEFSSISSSFATCFHMLAGDFPYDRLQQANPRLAPVFFVTFVVLVLQIMVNMFVAILSEYYESAKEVENDEDDVEYDIITRLREFLSACSPTVDARETIILRPNQTVRLISTNMVDKEQTRNRAKKLFRGVVWRIVALLRFGMKFDQKLGFVKSTPNKPPPPDPNRTRYIPLSENFDHNTIKTMLPKGITIRLEGEAILGQHTLLRVVQHGGLSVECVVLPGENQEDVMELVGGEKLKLPYQLFVFHVVKLIFRELRHGVLRATKWWDPYESKIVDDYHLYQLLQEERKRGKQTLRFDELSRLLDLYFRKEKRNREFTQEEVKHETALVMYRFRNSLIDMPSREKEGHDYVPNPVDTSAVELSASLLSLGEHMAENCHDIWAIERIQQGWKWGPRRDDNLKTHPNLIPFKEMSKEEQSYDFRTSMETIKTIVAMKYSIARGRRGADGITRTLTHSSSTASDKVTTASSPKSGTVVRSFSLMDATHSVPYGRSGQSYSPRPADTTAVIFPASLRRLMDLLAENAHEVWSKGRMDDGWTYGQQRNDKNKKHPCLVPYVFLTDAEKDYDLKTAEATLKMLYALGYLIVDSNGHNLV